MRKLRNLLQVVYYARHDGTCLMIVEISERQPLEMLKSLSSHIRLHINAHHMTVILHEIFQSRLDYVYQKQGDSPDGKRTQL